MTIDEIKRKNLIRLCGEHHCETPTKLASVLGVTRQHALQGLQDDCLKVKNDIQEIYKRMADAADTKDVRRLKKVG